MKRIDLDFESFDPPQENLAICLGYFDGVHIGHKQIINNAINMSDYNVALLTFDQPVSNFFDNAKSKDVLTSLEDRYQLVDRLGVDYFYVLKLTPSFLNEEPLKFIEFLQKLRIKEVFVGEDYRFGKNRTGDIPLLKKYFKVYVTKIVSIDGKKVSSQEIIANIKNGNTHLANLLLGQNYRISGIISEGHHNGEKLGIRTANVSMATNYVMPKFGVYSVVVHIDDKIYKAIANVGIHPTIDVEDKPIVEVHIPNYDSIDYGKKIKVEFIDFLRPERKFASTEELIAQVKSDIRSIS